MRDGGAVSALRVVQWATGNIGTRSLSAVIDHPDLELVGVYVHSADKAGRDAGELCDRPTTGISATNDVDEILALRADCVLYMPAACDFDEVRRILEAGTNVVTTRGEFLRPASMDPQRRAEIEAACETGKASIHSTGSSPGFITEAMPLLLSSLQRRVDRIVISEFADLSKRNSPELLFGLMGFGQPPAEADPARAAYLAASFGPSLELVADALALPLDGVTGSGEVATAKARTVIAAGTLEQGTVAAQRTTVSGMRDGKPLIEFRATWYCTADLEQDWKLRSTGWTISLEGDAPLDADITFTTPVEQMASVTPGYTAHRAVNAVAYLCAAASGIRTSLDLPQIVPALQ